MLAALMVFLLLGQDVVYEENLPADHEAIRYWTTEIDPPVSPAALRFEDDFGYLRSLLSLLEVPETSQTLVFSKSSLQRAHISPDNPRAIYFGDDAAVGYVPGSDVLEILSIDPTLGAVLYTLDNRASDPPRLERPKICLACHQAPATLGVPGGYVGSLFTTPSGEPTYRGSIVADHRTPFADRWGGWFVTEPPVDFAHRANAVLSGPTGTELETIPLRYDPRRYLRPGSDVVALMVLEHQTHTVNLVTRLGWEARIGLDVDHRIEQAVDALLLTDEPELETPLERTDFANVFDRGENTLRALDLDSRLFRYAVSFVVGSASFAALPEDVRVEVYRRILARLPEDDDAIAIVAATVTDVPELWRRRE